MTPEERDIWERIEMHVEHIAAELRALTRREPKPDPLPDVYTHDGSVPPWENEPDDTKPQARCLYEDEPPSRAVA